MSWSKPEKINEAYKCNFVTEYINNITYFVQGFINNNKSSYA